MSHNPQTVVQVNKKCSEAFVLERSVRQGCSLPPLLCPYFGAPALKGLQIRGQIQCCSVSLLLAICILANDITVFVYCHLDIKAVKKTVVKYKRIAGTKVNFDKSEGLWLSAWTSSNNLPGPFHWSDKPVRILGLLLGPNLQLEQNWSEVQAKVDALMATWLRRRLSSKGRVEASTAYIFPLILNRLCVLPLPEDRWLVLQQSLTRLLCGGQRPIVHRQVCIQHTCNGGLGMPDLESHWLTERLVYLGCSLSGDVVWRWKASNTFPCLK